MNKYLMDSDSKLLSRLESILSRENDLRSLEALTSIFEPSAETDALPLAESVIGLDSNVFLRLATHSNSVDILDFVTQRLKTPLVIPGQTIQEFWNNQFSAIDTVSKKVEKNVDELKRIVKDFSNELEEGVSDLQNAVDTFSEDYAFIYDPSIKSKIISMLRSLQSSAIVPYVSRTRFAGIADIRHLTKTPPGFRDDGHGDFFVWADFLLGLMKSAASKNTINRVIFVTNEKKADWIKNQSPHPLLIAEVEALTGKKFEIWNLDKLGKEIQSAIEQSDQ